MIGALTSIAGMGLNLFGGLQQAAEIRRQAEIRLRQMRKQRDQELGAATASAAASGVEMSSKTVQGYLSEMNKEWDLRFRDFDTTVANSEAMSMVSAAGAAFGSMAKGISGLGGNYSMAGTNFGTDAGASQLNDTLDWRWDK